MLFFPKFQQQLKSKFPIIFIDEYQDTDIALAESIVSNLIDNDSGLVVGLFGDHWQKIYGSSACGLISTASGKIIEIGKKANFRSDKNIVECLNRMRPSLPQSESNPQSQGIIKVFHSNDWNGSRRDGKGGGHWTNDLPEENVKEYINKVKELMIADGWDLSAKNTKILFLTNNLIASEQNFKNLADCYRYSDDYLKKGDKYIQFFLEIVEPTISAFEHKEYGELFQIGRKNHPHLQSQADKKLWSDNLNRLMEERSTETVGDVLYLLSKSKTPLFSAKVELSEERYAAALLKKELGINLDDEEDAFFKKQQKIRSIDYQEVINLGKYIDEKTPFSTKHGVKGAEFDNVLVVFGRGWNHYNWGQMLEWIADGVPKNEEEKFDRNRNLFYVSCSRAKHNLTILFTQELSKKALSVVQEIFGKDSIIGDPF